MSEETKDFLPIKAINVYMQPDFKRSVIDEVLSNTEQLSDQNRRKLLMAVKRYVRVKGFRNPNTAPLSMKTKAFFEAFEKESALIRITLDLWAAFHEQLATNIKDLLEKAKWRFQPLDEGIRDDGAAFIVGWPEGQNFETIYKAYTSQFADTPASKDEVSLMTIWVSGLLPLSDLTG